MKKNLWLILMAIFFLLVFASCGKGPSTRLHYDLDAEPSSVDPQTADDKNAFEAMNNLYEGLMTVDENGVLTEGLAESYQVSEDGLTYRFVLKPGLKWSNDYPLTASDFVFGFQRLFDPNTRSEMAPSFYCIQNAQAIAEGVVGMEQLGVTAISDTELEIRLDYPNVLFTQLLTTTPAMPCNEQFFQETKGTYGLDADSVITTGPFQLDSWAHGEDGYLKLVKNPNYYAQETVKLNSVILWTGYSEEEQVSRFAAETTQAFLYSGKQDASLQDFDNLSLSEQKHMVWALAVNTASPRFSNRNLRLALAHCFDLSRLEEVLPEYLSVATGLVPPDILLDGESYRELSGNLSPPYDAAAAQTAYQTALAELQGVSMEKLTVLVPSDDGGIQHEQYFSYLNQMIQKELNLFITVEQVEPGELQSRLETGDFELAIQSFYAGYHHPLSILSAFETGNYQNFYHYQNAEFDRYLNQALYENKTEVSLESCKAAEQILLQDAAVMPLYYQADYLAVNTVVQGVMKNPQNNYISFRYAYFTD